MQNFKSIRMVIMMFAILSVLLIGIQSQAAQTESRTDTTPRGMVGSPAEADQLGQHFQKAQQDMSRKSYAGAAAEIQKAAAFMEDEEKRCANDAKHMLTASVQELKQLARRLELGAAVSDEKIRLIFARAYQALAQNYQLKAYESDARKSASDLRQNIQAAAEHLEKAWHWSGHQDKMTIDSGIDLTTAIMQVARTKIPTVVHITATERQVVANPLLPFENSPFFRRYFGLPKKMPKKFERELIGVGSGIIIDSKGHILTNNHVVEGANKIEVKLSDGSAYSAKVLGTDPKTDLGVIQISANAPLPFATFGDSDKVEVGQWVVAIGQPESLSESVSQGIISAKHRTGITDPSTYQDFLQTDAAINPGNSGGPLLDLQGNVIGINSAIFSTTGGFQGISFAIPSNMAAHVAQALMKYGKVERGWLGVTLQEITPKLAQSFDLKKPEGAVVTQVMKSGPADKAGLEVGDVITAIKGRQISRVAELRNTIADMHAGQEADLTVLRNGKALQITVKIGNLEEMNKQLAASLKERLGILVEPVPDLQASAYGLSSGGGVMIRWVDPKGPLGKVGFEPKDIILAVDGHPIEDVETFTNLIDSLPRGDTIVVIAIDHRTGQEGSVKVKLG